MPAHVLLVRASHITKAKLTSGRASEYKEMWFIADC